MRRLVRLSFACFATWAALLALPTTGLAASTLKTSASYTIGATPCNAWGGQSDQNGVYYYVCGNATVSRNDIDGAALPNLALPNLGVGPIDIAPSPDGSYLYVEQNTNSPIRYNRQPNGTYVRDATWKLQDFPYGGKNWRAFGRLLQTDGRGDIYLSNGSYWAGNAVATPSAVVKYSPDGTLLTQFGDYGKEDGNWITNMGLAVSRDGRRVWVGENCGTACTNGSEGSRVTRYDFVAGGRYKFRRIISTLRKNIGNNAPQCETPGATLSAYALGIDFRENLYVTSTTCGMIQKFSTNVDPAQDAFVETIGTFQDENRLNATRLHAIGVDWAGRVTTYEWGRRLNPAVINLPELPVPVPPALPTPDVTAPTITAVTLPASTTTQDVEIGVTATDDTAVAEMRLTNEDGNPGPWQPFAPKVIQRLTNGYLLKGITVEVRDMSGNVSASVFKTILFERPAPGGGGGNPIPGDGVDVADPVVTAITLPPTTATQTINLGINATDDIGVTQVRLANEDGNFGAWRAFANTVTWTLTAGYTNKAVFVQVQDASGKISTSVLGRTAWVRDVAAPPDPPAPGDPDVAAPVLVSVAMPAETTTQSVNVKLNATDNVAVTEMRLANEDGNWLPWKAFDPDKAWLLSAGFSGKLVFAQVRDARGNESATMYARTSYVRTVAGPVDNADPVIVAATVPNPAIAQLTEVTINATDDVQVTEVRLANEDGNWGAWKAFTPKVAHTLTVGNHLNKAVLVQVRDAAGHESNVVFLRTLLEY